MFMLYRVAQNSWDDSYRLHSSTNLKPVSPANGDKVGLPNGPPPQPIPDRIAGKGKASEEDDAGVHIPILKKPGGDDGAKTPTKTSAGMANRKHPGLAAVTPTTNKKLAVDKDEDDELSIHWRKPPKTILEKEKETETRIHWEPVSEHFPVAKESLIPLPTGTPPKIPRIQHVFGAEAPDIKAKRVERQKRVQKEIQRAWSGYKKYAWMHDELSPISNQYRDPFCGWAATLVDSLDTLWIAGLKDEFDEAAKAVKDIDFTYTPKSAIPVFETTIRYLGGLLGAFDVSGGKEGKYAILLEKAVELSDILMGIFDTPNRMPILYYHWQPEYASQPHVASNVGMAELATLSLEFTRLAQLTNKAKYYDAVARITNALAELQETGTTIPGLFPESLDASGCNRTATALESSMSKQAQKQLDSDRHPKKPQGYVAGAGVKGSTGTRPSPADAVHQRRDDLAVEVVPKTSGSSPNVPTQKLRERKPPLAADGSTSEWECVPQGLVPRGYGIESYHMGGGQDSAYEYFPKEYLLLGGLEPKYKKLHIDTIKAIDEWLLYRPMTKDKWDILFPAKVSTSGDPAQDLQTKYEITHLTCFIGGMYGLGGKIFGREADVETAKRLTNGCVWAYQITTSGIMPEGSQVVPCPTLEKCDFNETLWWDRLDSSGQWRDDKVEEWEKEVKLIKEQQAKVRQPGTKAGDLDEVRSPTAGAPKQSALDNVGTEGKRQVGASVPISDNDSPGTLNSVSKRAVVPKVGLEAGSEEDKGSRLPQSLKDKIGMKSGEAPGLKNSKGSVEKESSVEPTRTEKSTAGDDSTPGNVADDIVDRRKAGQVDSVFEANRLPTVSEIPLPAKPESHEEYVKAKIKDSRLPPGFVSIDSSSYILRYVVPPQSILLLLLLSPSSLTLILCRPEAIESVWYMYRITGDTTWMDKGWKMFEATIRATRTEIANSAIDDVTSDEPGLRDEMESFWLAETLKYYYLLFSEPDVISLDEWVLNTEAHPLRRPKTV